MSNDIPQDDEPLFALKAANESSLEKFDQRMSDLIEFASTVYISSEVRDECVKERCRIHSKDYEHLTDSSEAQIRISMIQLMLRRLTGAKYRDRFRYKRPRTRTTA